MECIAILSIALIGSFVAVKMFPSPDVEIFHTKKKTTCYRLGDKFECYERYLGESEQDLERIADLLEEKRFKKEKEDNGEF